MARPPAYLAAYLLSLALCTPALAQTVDCPPAPDISAEAAPLLRALATAPDPATAQTLTAQMWDLWTRAPDARAQALLDEGMERREAYDFAAAETALNDLVAYCPDYAEGWNQRAFVHFLRGDPSAALGDLERALELSPDHFAARAGQGLSLLQLGRRKAGLGALRAALALNPWLPERRYLPPEPPGTDL